jgi:hypothetical protein
MHIAVIGSGAAVKGIHQAGVWMLTKPYPGGAHLKKETVMADPEVGIVVWARRTSTINPPAQGNADLIPSSRR